MPITRALEKMLPHTTHSIDTLCRVEDAMEVGKTDPHRCRPQTAHFAISRLPPLFGDRTRRLPSRGVPPEASASLLVAIAASVAAARI